MEPHRVTRTIRLDAPADEVWAAVGTVDGLGTWLGAAVRADHDALAPGRSAEVTDPDGTVRRLVVTEVDEGRSVGFAWWDRDRPGLASAVTLTVDADGPGGTAVTVTETLDPAARGAADAATSGWDVRLANLCAALAPGLVPA